MRILVTGGSGFIGSHLCRALIGKGHEVICMDNLITGNLDNIKDLHDSSDFEFIEHDVAKYIEIASSPRKFGAPRNDGGCLDYVLHLASPASPIDYLNFPIQTLKVGSLGTHNALGVAKAKGAKFLLTSTSEVYGDPLVNPQPEDYWGNVNCVGPRGVYDEAKRFAEAITMAYHKVHNVDVKIARIFNTFGPNMRSNDGRVVPNFISQALAGDKLTVYGDGTQTRSFCYIDDMVDGLLKLMESDVNEPVNLGNPQEMTVLKLAERVVELAKGTCKRGTDTFFAREKDGKKVSVPIFKPLPVNDPKVRRPDISKAKKLLGWEPRVGLEEGLKRTIEWFKEQQ